MTRRAIIDTLKYVVALVLMVYVIWANWGTPGSNGLGDVWRRHVVEGKPIDFPFLAAALVIYSVALVLTLLRWYLLVRAQDLPFTVPLAMRYGMIGFFFNMFLPGSVGGDIIKAAVLAREQSRRTVAVATVIMDRIIALWGLIWFVAVLGGAFWLTGNLEGIVAERSKLVVGTAQCIVAVTLTIWLALGLLPDRRAQRFSLRLEGIPKIGMSAAEFWRAIWMYRQRQGVVYLVLGISWVAQTGFVLAFYCCARTLWDGTPQSVPGLVQHFLLVPIGLVIQAAIPLPGGAGAGEFSFGKLYVYFGGAEASGVLASLMQRILGWAIGLVGCYLYLRGRASLPSPAGIDESGDALPVEATQAT